MSSSQEMEFFIKNYLSQPGWRLDNLYTIVNKEDKKVTLRLNFAQKLLFSVKHPKTITLKSRQQGISTYKVAEGLDKCIYNEYTQAGIQSYGQSESKKLYKKALLMWEEYDKDIIELLDIKLISANAEGLTFSNGSTLKIGNFRGDTLSSLHVSELAKIAKKFPEKADELNTGAFEAVSTNSSISIESTAEGAAGLFFDMWRRAERRLQLVGVEGLTPLDFYPIFLSWTADPDCNMREFYEPTQDDLEYFDLVEKYDKKKLTQSQRNWCAAKRARLGDLFDREYPYCPEAAFRVSVEGTYYKKQYEKLIKDKRIKSVPYEPGYPVFAVFDLGINDTMVLGYWQLVEGVPRLIGSYSNSGERIEHYVEVMRLQPYPINMVYLPHDAEVTELSTGRTRVQEFQRLGCFCQVLSKLSIQEGINATRQLLDVAEIEIECEDVVDAIQLYRQKYDKRLKVFLGIPEHDEHSHAADMVRYASLALGFYKVANSKTPDPRDVYNRHKAEPKGMAF